MCVCVNVCVCVCTRAFYVQVGTAISRNRMNKVFSSLYSRLSTGGSSIAPSSQKGHINFCIRTVCWERAKGDGGMGGARTETKS